MVCLCARLGLGRRVETAKEGRINSEKGEQKMGEWADGVSVSGRIGGDKRKMKVVQIPLRERIQKERPRRAI